MAPLEPQKTWDALHVLACDAEPILLCHEHLRKPGEHCHRRLVAEWLEEMLGVVVPELAIEKKPIGKNQLELLF